MKICRDEYLIKSVILEEGETIDNMILDLSRLHILIINNTYAVHYFNVGGIDLFIFGGVKGKKIEFTNSLIFPLNDIDDIRNLLRNLRQSVFIENLLSKNLEKGEKEFSTALPIQTAPDTNFKEKRSHIGMIIHSTTLDTMEKVIEIYGGRTWVKIEGRFLLGQSSDYKINSTGGEEKHKLTINEIPSHDHNCRALVSLPNLETHRAGSNHIYREAEGVAFSKCSRETMSTRENGGGTSHNNMPPYKVVYIWERTV